MDVGMTNSVTVTADRQPVDEVFLADAKLLLDQMSVVRDGAGRAMDPNSIEADPTRFEERRRMAWALVLVAYTSTLDEAGLDRSSLHIDHRLLYDAIKGIRTAAIFHNWKLTPLNPVSQRNAVRDIIDRAQYAGKVEGVPCRIWLEDGRICVDDSLLDLLLHLLHMLDPSLKAAKAPVRA